MKGSFNVGLLEIFAYLLPGGFILVLSLFRVRPQLLQEEVSAGMIIAGLAASYIIGHVLTHVSLVVMGLRMLIQKRKAGTSREERYSFYPELQKYLMNSFGEDLSRGEEYRFCLRLVAERMPTSNQTIDRFYALTLFSRNLVVALVAAALLFSISNWIVSIISLAGAMIFFQRYVDLDKATASTVFRSAFVFFRLQAGGNANDDDI
ncbi:MAG: hypothetical protein GY835_09460 [bacterium]|nr:hypothetical protein [bacterium]